MTRFKIAKRLDLSFLGKDWEGCYLEFSSIPFSQMEGLSKLSATPEKVVGEIVSVLEKFFMGGEAIGEDGERVVVKKEDIKEFPFEVIAKIINLMVVEIEKKN